VTRRPSARFGAFLAVLLLLLLAMLADARRLAPPRQQEQAARAVLVQQLGLSDLALFTEARYTRHLSLADLHSPFQDHPLALDHFPSGSVVPPPPARLPHYAPLDREATLPD
jgi:hypothetical protein